MPDGVQPPSSRPARPKMKIKVAKLHGKRSRVDFIQAIFKVYLPGFMFSHHLCENLGHFAEAYFKREQAIQ